MTLHLSKAAGLVSAVSLGLFGLAAPSVSLAQGIPPGSYQQTCNNITVVDNVLEATCQAGNGSMVNAALPNYAGCSYGVINQNGSLVCGAPQQLTTQTSDGETDLPNTCGNQAAVYVIAATHGGNAIAIYVNSGQTVKVDVERGAQYISACGRPPTNPSNFQYMNIVPIP